MSHILKAVLTAVAFPAGTTPGALRFTTYQSPMVDGDVPVNQQDSDGDSVTVTLPPGNYVTVVQRLDASGAPLGASAESPEWTESPSSPPDAPATVMIDIPSTVSAT
jgi:hypothetical protein